jgi:purine-nucleoside phosphorylase
MTPHISSKLNQIAKVVLMPGDPLRAKWIAENYLKNYKLVNEVRGMLAYTGYYNNKKITVFGHGMGMPSIGIYSYELFNVYKVNTIIRIGSCGSYKKELNVGDIVITKDTVSNSVYANDVGVKVKNQTLTTESKLLDLALQTANEFNIKVTPARVASSDVFYNKYSLAQQAKL